MRSRDTLMKSLFGDIFKFIIECINSEFSNHALEKNITILDIAGFGEFSEKMHILYVIFNCCPFFYLDL